VSQSYIDCILAVPKEGCHRHFKPCCNDFVVKTSQECFFMLPFASSFKIFINVFIFLYVNANCKTIGEEALLPFFQKNGDRLIISKKCVAAPIFLFGFQ